MSQRHAQKRPGPVHYALTFGRVTPQQAIHRCLRVLRRVQAQERSEYS